MCIRDSYYPITTLTGGAGVEMDRRHNGPMVYENMETSVPGIFAAHRYHRHQNKLLHNLKRY